MKVRVLYCTVHMETIFLPIYRQFIKTILVGFMSNSSPLPKMFFEGVSLKRLHQLMEEIFFSNLFGGPPVNT
jgi:hypothetical protein